MLCELIEAGVDVHARDKKGSTPMMYAAEHDGPAGPLLKAGEDPCLVNTGGETALMKCFTGKQKRFKKTTRALTDVGADINKMDCYSTHIGVSHGNALGITASLFWVF